MEYTEDQLKEFQGKVNENKVQVGDEKFESGQVEVLAHVKSGNDAGFLILQPLKRVENDERPMPESVVFPRDLPVVMLK